MASLTFLEELGDAAGSTDLADRIRVWFEQVFVVEEGFCNTMSHCVALDCLISLRNTQMRDLEKLLLLTMLVTDSSRCIHQAKGNIAHLDSGGGVVQVNMGGGSGGGMKKRV
ncbi:hypothetical protein Tco_1375499 [Tanacetum coccineum]